ncbi:hypothetical protein F442_10603, partial [Phytophthora nicotianae P10297]
MLSWSPAAANASSTPLNMPEPPPPPLSLQILTAEPALPSLGMTFNREQ